MATRPPPGPSSCQHPSPVLQHHGQRHAAGLELDAAGMWPSSGEAQDVAIKVLHTTAPCPAGLSQQLGQESIGGGLQFRGCSWERKAALVYSGGWGLGSTRVGKGAWCVS